MIEQLSKMLADNSVISRFLEGWFIHVRVLLSVERKLCCAELTITLNKDNEEYSYIVLPHRFSRTYGKLYNKSSTVARVVDTTIYLIIIK